MLGADLHVEDTSGDIITQAKIASLTEFLAGVCVCVCVCEEHYGEELSRVTGQESWAEGLVGVTQRFRFSLKLLLA